MVPWGQGVGLQGGYGPFDDLEGICANISDSDDLEVI